jgi:alpha-tubulin suppressor-like RCC1 family protein
LATCSSDKVTDAGVEGDYCYGQVSQCGSDVCRSESGEEVPKPFPERTKLCYQSDRLHCDPVTDRCIPNHKQGETCLNSAAECTPGLACRAASSSLSLDAPTYCQQPGQEGEPCLREVDCARGLLCSTATYTCYRSGSTPAPFSAVIEACATFVPTLLESNSAVPAVPIAPSQHAAPTVALGWAHSCAVLGDGTVKCWGRNAEGQMGLGITYPAGYAPIPLPPTPVVGISNARSIAAADSYTCAVLTDGQVTCWGTMPAESAAKKVVRPSPELIPGLANIVSVHAGGAQTCAIDQAGTAWCWGPFGCDGLPNQRSACPTPETPTPVPDLSGVVDIDARGLAVCAILATGEGRCWGKGQLGQVATSSSAVPINIPSLSDAIALSDTCALRATGEILCWHGVDAANMRPAATTAETITGAVDVAAGGSFACVLLGSGRVQCWGSYLAEDQVGRGFAAGLAAQNLADVCNVSNAVAIFAGETHACGLLADGRLLCWGDNQHGQIGHGDGRAFNQPVVVQGL